MTLKTDVILAAHELGFADIGFTSAEPFEEHRQILLERQNQYAWAQAAGLDLSGGTDPAAILPGAGSVIVLMEAYFNAAFPRSMEGHFGRCYLDDDRVTHDGLSRRIKAFRAFLRDRGISSKVPFNLPHRVAAARAGMGTFGKNCLFYSSTVARRSSWVLPIAVVVDRVFEPGQPTLETGCPDWCRNACIAACPTRALKGNGRIDPRLCISYLSYFGEGLTPLELREPMGLYVYGCDRCQNVCPRNQAWLAQDLPPNGRVAAKAEYFDLPRLLAMDRTYFESRIRPHMFYMSHRDLWRWKMNVARAMGNTLDPKYIPDLIRAFYEEPDERVRAMAVWAIARIGGQDAEAFVLSLDSGSGDLVDQERLRAKPDKS